MFRLFLMCLLIAGCARNHYVTVSVQMVTCSASLHYETTVSTKESTCLSKCSN
jgi:general stress protein CsbA